MIQSLLNFKKHLFRNVRLGDLTHISEIDTSCFEVTVVVVDKKQLLINAVPEPEQA